MSSYISYPLMLIGVYSTIYTLMKYEEKNKFNNHITENTIYECDCLKNIEICSKCSEIIINSVDEYDKINNCINIDCHLFKNLAFICECEYN